MDAIADQVKSFLNLRNKSTILAERLSPSRSQGLLHGC